MNDVEDLIPDVRAIAWKRFHWVPPHQATFEDLVQVGMEAVCRVAKTFDPARGITWEAYACFRATAAMLDHLRTTRPGPRHAPLPWPKSTDEPIAVSGSGEPLMLADVLGVDDPEPQDDNLVRAMMAEVDRLPEHLSRTLRLYAEAELTMGEVAALEGVTEPAISLRLKSARAALQPRLRALGVAA